MRFIQKENRSFIIDVITVIVAIIAIFGRFYYKFQYLFSSRIYFDHSFNNLIFYF